MKKKSLIGYIARNWTIKTYIPRFQSWYGTPYIVLPRVTSKLKHKIKSRIDKIKVRITIEELK